MAMRCSEVEQCVQRYLDRELPAAEAAALTAHLGECVACGSSFGPMVAAIAAVESAAVPEPRAQLYDRVLADVAMASGVCVWGRRSRWAGAMAVAAAAIVGVVALTKPPVTTTVPEPVAVEVQVSGAPWDGVEALAVLGMVGSRWGEPTAPAVAIMTMRATAVLIAQRDAVDVDGIEMAVCMTPLPDGWSGSGEDGVGGMTWLQPLLSTGGAVGAGL